MSKIEVGQIYIVNSDNFLTSKSNSLDRQIKLNANELIEIRYAYEWHFRTLDDHYWHSKPEEIESHCTLFAVIWNNVRFSNRCSLSEIINLGLCDFKGKNNYSWAKDFDRAFLEKMKLEKLISSFEEKHKPKKE